MSGSELDPPGASSSDEGTSVAPQGTPAPVDLTRDRRARTTWVVFLAGPVIWFTHFMLVYVVAEAGCTGDGPGLDRLDPPVPVITTLAATGVAVLLCGVAAAWGWRWWRASVDTLTHASDAAPELSGDFDDDRRRGSLAFAGFALSVFSLGAILFTGAPALVLGPC